MIGHARNVLACVLFLLFTVLASRGETVVKWDALKKLDVLAEKCEALSEQKNIAELRKIAPEVKKAAAVVAADKLPDGAKQPAQVKILQDDLKNLTDAITDPEKQDGEELAAILAGVHPVVEKLMETSGVPHVHEEEKDSKK